MVSTLPLVCQINLKISKTLYLDVVLKDIIENIFHGGNDFFLRKEMILLSALRSQIVHKRGETEILLKIAVKVRDMYMYQYTPRILRIFI